MVSAAKRYGSSLLALTTLRPPDLDRGTKVVHLELTVPPVVTTQIKLWEAGSRGPLDPREAAALPVERSCSAVP
jgi:hypothetical protein